MAEEKVGEIRISKRIVRIGHQVYPLANISRVQTLRLVWGGRLATFYPLQEITVLLVVIGAIAGAAVVVLPELDLNSNVEEAAQQLATVAAILAGIRMAYLLLVLFYRLQLRQQYYALVIETAGTQYTALHGTDLDEIHRIEDVIVNAIEDPPPHEQTVQIRGDLVIGDKVGRDKIEQSGTDNRMIINR